VFFCEIFPVIVAACRSLHKRFTPSVGPSGAFSRLSVIQPQFRFLMSVGRLYALSLSLWLGDGFFARERERDRGGERRGEALR
jgi:hypothetical protein